MTWLRSILSVAAAAAVVSAQTTPALDANTVVDSHRPLADSADLLERKFGWVITYEDPVWEFENDSVDLVLRSKSVDRRLLAPRPGRIPLGAVLSAAGPKPERAAVVARLIEAHEGSGNPGSFRIVAAGEYLHLVPAFARSAKGTRDPVVPLLDTPISTSMGELPPSLAIRKILDEVERARGIKVVSELSWEFDRMVFGTLKVQIPASRQSARNLIAGVLRHGNRPLTWRLLCEPSTADQRGFCVFNLRQVYVNVADPSGRVVERPVR